MKRILFDLTDLESWHGHHGGTQRVVYGIGKEFYKRADKGLEVEYIAFSPRDNEFYVTSFAPIYEHTESQRAVSASQPEQFSMTPGARLKQVIRPYLPERLRKSKRARATVQKAVCLSKSVTQKARQKIQGKRKSSQTVSNRQKVTFTENDVVLVLGKPWDNPSMEQALTNAKANSGFKLAQFIHDLIIPLYPQLHHPSLYKNFTQYAFEAIYNSDLILSNSRSSEKDARRFAKLLNLQMPNTQVIRLADEIIEPQEDISKPDPRIANEFITCVGTIEIRKNHTLLYYAYKLAESRGIKLPQLVIVGARGWLTGDFQYLVEHDPATKENIIILDNINDQGLSWIYTNAKFSIYPSFYEGWGLPVAEALANGQVCIASNASSIPEIGCDLIDYFTPYDATACLDLIIKYLDPSTLKHKEAQITEEYKSTSWEDSYKQVIDAITKL